MTTTEQIQMATDKMHHVLNNLERIAGTAGNGDLRTEIMDVNAVLDRLEKCQISAVTLAANQVAAFVCLTTGGIVPMDAVLAIARKQFGL